MLALFISMLLVLPAVAEETPLSPYFGYFRVRGYNGVENKYSNRFFMPSIHTEPSNRMRFSEKDAPLKALKLNFEVPLEMEDGSIHLMHLFVEVPVDRAKVEAGADSATVLFEGEVEELLAGKWEACTVNFEAELKRWNEKNYTVEVKKEASLPCPSAAHSYLLERVNL